MKRKMEDWTRDPPHPIHSPKGPRCCVTCGKNALSWGLWEWKIGWNKKRRGQKAWYPYCPEHESPSEMTVPITVEDPNAWLVPEEPVDFKRDEALFGEYDERAGF